jgi:hypothetical protein
MSAAEHAAPPGGRLLRPDPELIRAFWDALVRPGETHEIRIPKTRRGPARLFGTTAGYFTDGEAAIRAALPITGLDAPAVYVTLNPVNRELRARADNRLVTGIATTTSDEDVVRRRHFLVDVDPKRPSETSATDEERDAALAVRDAVRAYLADLGWPEPVAETMSGNGGGLLFRIDLPNNDQSTALVVNCLAALGERFDTATVTTDRTVYNPARITKVVGTVAAKGDDCPDLGRTWRLATGTVCPEAGTVPRALLDDLARLATVREDAQPERGDTSATAGDGRPWKIAELLSAKGIGWHLERRRYAVAYCLDRCLTSAAHDDGAAILEFPSGALDFRCQHHSCRDKGWPDARAALGLEVPRGAPRAAAAPSEPWPVPDDLAAPAPAPILPLALFPREIAEYAEDLSDRLQCPADYVTWTLTVAGAGLIGRGAGIRPKRYDEWTERPCLWVALIGPPSWMKSPALAEGFRPLHRQQARDHERHLLERADWEAACRALRASAQKGEAADLPDEPIEERRWTADATIEKLADLMASARGLTLKRDELAGWAGQMNKYSRSEGDRQFYLETYSGGSFAVDRIKRGTTWVPDLYLNIVGGVQPTIARDLFGTGPDDGLAARFVAVWPELTGEWRAVDRPPNVAARDALDRVSDRLASQDWAAVLATDTYKPQPYCRPDPDGLTLLAEWRERVMRPLRRGEYEGRHAGRIGKYDGLVARLVLVFHLIEWAAGRSGATAVPAETVARALELMDDYLVPMDARVYRAYGEGANAEGGRRVAAWIRHKRLERLTVREVQRHGWAGLQERPDALAALVWLAVRGWIREAEDERRVGRPSSGYLVNPRLWEGR